MANLTITPIRRAVVDFTDPVLTDMNEVVVTGPNSPPIVAKLWKQIFPTITLWTSR